MLISWIDSGAACDADPTADLMRVARAATAEPPPVVAAPRPCRSGRAMSHLHRTSCPILLDQCVNCHGEATGDQLRMTSLESLIQRRAHRAGHRARARRPTACW